MTSLENGQLTGNNFEEVLFQQLVKYPDVLFKATNLNGDPTTDVYIKFDHFINLEKDQLAPGKEHAKSLIRGYARYPWFDFMVGCIFIQVSVSPFDKHNKNTANISKAFDPYYYSNDPRNQIEVYLDTVFGSGHKAIFNNQGHFVVTQNSLPVLNFCIVYMRGSPGAPRHHQLVKQYRDVAFIDYDKIKGKLFGDLLR
jgi:hypothetical protein